MTEAVERLVRLVEARTGLELSRGGARDALLRHLGRRLRHLGLEEHDLEPYLLRLGEALPGAPASGITPELQALIDAITVTHTWFMRDAEQLAVLTHVLRARDRARPPLSVWVPACATGEDAYSVALLATRLGRTVNVVGTDLNVSALALARRGQYGAWSVRELPRSELRAFARSGDGFRVPDALRAMVSFERHNLLDPPVPPPAARGWDVVLCRNVLIYFAPERARKTLATLGAALDPEGVLLVGASDIVLETPANLTAGQLEGKLVFYHRDGARGASPRSSTPPPRLAPVSAPRVPVAPPPPPAPPPAASEPSSSTQERDRWLEAGHAHLERGAFGRALEAYRAAASADALSGVPRMYLGITHHVMGDVSAASDELRAASFLSPWLWPASFYLALCYESLGRHEDALREYRHAERLARDAVTSPLRPCELAGPLRGFARDLTELARRRAARLLGQGRSLTPAEPAPGAHASPPGTRTTPDRRRT